VTKQQDEDKKEWYLVGETCSGGRAVTVYFLKDATEKSKEKKKEESQGDKKPAIKPHQSTVFSSVQHTQMRRLESHQLGGGS